ncbi:MAG: T9SS type A sorting domain-containing protein [Ichthyobacteriaceae bacterium]|nr:T9SS type A sorting domain-containing protein [Ichthyobacteriaceae bacterium]
MIKNITLTLLLAMFVSFAFAQNKLNLENSSSRFTVGNRDWPAGEGEASVCLWDDDRLAAFTITIDDNIENNIPFWKSMNAKYGFNFTWFLITEAATQYNVSPKGWDLYNELAETGNQINGHDDRNWYTITPLPPGVTNPTDAEYLDRITATKTKVETEVTSGNNKCLTYAFPFGEGNETEARKIFIANRGTTGTLNQANEINYFNVNSISNPYVYTDQSSRDKYILPLITTSSTLFGENFYRGWGSTHFHALHTTAEEGIVDDFLQYLSDKEDDIWVDGFTRVAQYSQSFATHNLVIDEATPVQIKFTLTDDMLDSAFDYPLTVKIKVGDAWANVTATQNGASVAAKIISYIGSKYVLVNAVPDGGQVIVNGVIDDDPAIFDPIGDQTVMEEEVLELNFSASNFADSDITFIVDGVDETGFGVFTDNGDGTGSIVFSPQLYDKGTYNITINAYNGVSTTSISFVLTVTDDGSVNEITASKEDAAVYDPEHGFVDNKNRTEIIAGGSYSDDGKQLSAVFPFLLPLPNGFEVIDANFSLNLERTNGDVSGISLDLYGLDYRTAATVLVTDNYSGTYNGDTSADALQESFTTDATPVGVVEVNSSGKLKLIDYLNTQYDNNGAESFVFIRISPDVSVNNQYNRYYFTSSDGAELNDGIYPTLLIKFGKDKPLSNNDNYEKLSPINIYPNPSNGGELNISSKNFANSDVSIELINISGQSIFVKYKNAKQGNFTVNLDSGIAKGMYFLKIEGNNTISVTKIFID